MIQTALMFVPEEAYVLLVALSGLLIIVGLRKLGFALLGSVLLMALLGPFINDLIDSLPSWAFYTLCAFSALSILRLILGARVADYLISRFLYSLVMTPFWFLRWIFTGFRPRQRY
jgi:hypothetical protein